MIGTKQRINTVPTPHVTTTNLVRVLLIVEGTNDIDFLRRISVLLHANDSSLPHLADMERVGELIFVPCGGGVETWANRLQPLAIPEFHLYDRELPPETDYRQQAVERIAQRDNCVAVLTAKRSLENYLHPRAIRMSAGIMIDIDDFGPIAETAAKAFYRLAPVTTPWELLGRRARKRMTQRAKRWLNTQAVSQMNVDLLKDRDPDGEIISWFETIRHLSQAR